MFGSLGTGELLVILLVALLIFGSKRMPEIGRAIGKGIREFNRARQEVTDTLTKLTNEVEKPINEINTQITDSFHPDLEIPTTPNPQETTPKSPQIQKDEETSSEEQQPYLALLAASRRTQIKE